MNNLTPPTPERFDLLADSISEFSSSNTPEWKLLNMYTWLNRMIQEMTTRNDKEFSNAKLGYSVTYAHWYAEYTLSDIGAYEPHETIYASGHNPYCAVYRLYQLVIKAKHGQHTS